MNMRYSFAFLALLPSLAFAGWFGPDTADECVSEFGKRAADQRIVRVVYFYCSVAFNESKHQVERDRALCIVEEASKLKTGGAAIIVVRECEASHPAPACTEHAEFKFDLHSCACKPGFVEEAGVCRQNTFDRFD